MGNPFFKFKQFNIVQDQCAMKVTTDACLFGAWVASVSEKPERMLDMGAGTGLLSLMLAQVYAVHVDAVEIDPLAFEQLSSNIRESPWNENMHPHHQDIKLFASTDRYDLIISNPPFHEHHLEGKHASSNLARHSNKLDLLGLFTVAERLASADAQFFILLPFYRKSECMELSQKMGWHLHHHAEVKQSPKHDQFRVMFGFGRGKLETRCEEITIKNTAGEYTPAFCSLLKDYYLYL